MLPPAVYIGDEIDVLNDSWMFLIWTSDHCPYRSNSVASRWPIAVIPKSLYLMDDQTGLNLTVAAATAEIVASFNRLSSQGIKIKSFPSMGRDVATLSKITEMFLFALLIWPKTSTVFVGISMPDPVSWDTLRPGSAPETFRDRIQRRLEELCPGLQPQQNTAER